LNGLHIQPRHCKSAEGGLPNSVNIETQLQARENCHMAIDLSNNQSRMNSSSSTRSRLLTGISVAFVLAIAPALSACNSSSQMLAHGFQASDDTLDLVPVGSSREQVLLSLGTPSTTLSQDGEVFYYISQTRKRTMAFQKPTLIDQKVLAVYFDKEQTVSQLANYGLKDGKVFDYISRTTQTGGRELTFLGQVLGAATSGVVNPFGG
jgi:outer membrane protein assembly factor BamE (lipoprotein component of BamABCDE complex)